MGMRFDRSAIATTIFPPPVVGAIHELPLPFGPPIGIGNQVRPNRDPRVLWHVGSKEIVASS